MSCCNNSSILPIGPPGPPGATGPAGPSWDLDTLEFATTGILTLDTDLPDSVSTTRFAWLGTGNTGTTAGTNFIGTIDSIDFVIKTNNTERVRVLATTGKVGIGVSPTAFLDVLGTTEQVRIGYDVSNYYSTTVSSTGLVSYNAVGSGAGFRFLDQVYNLGGGGIAGNAAFGISALIGNTTGANNAAFGERALVLNTTGSGNIAVGYDTLSSNLIGNYCVAIGNAVLAANTANNNIGIGGFALQTNVSGIENVAIGYTAGQSITQNYNIAIGTNALKAGGGNGGCVALGYNALTVATAQYNVGIGFGSGAANTSGVSNTYVGTSAGTTNITGDANVFVGYQAGYYETTSNKLFIDNTQRTNQTDGRNKALVYGKFDAATANQFLVLNGALYLQNSVSNTNYYKGVLVSGVLTWTDTGSTNAPT